jgi:hypothetical protein
MDEAQDSEIPTLDDHAERVARRLSEAHASFAEAVQEIGADYDELLRAVARLGSAYAFDRAGRPGAIEAVRQALPAVERDLFDAILDDYACELAAVQEGLLRIALAYGRRRATQA